MSITPHFLDALDTAPGHWPETPCKSRPELFVDSSRVIPLKEDRDTAKALCALCPVRRACADYAIDNDIRDGIYGGLTVDERNQRAHERVTAACAE
ncbi:WhiB family transcriptional regulator [Streptomyces afghaniensis]|uniref:WhiB family transcriptional regulator n=1 Tax=Streptomyces afghaniensis TaxID=66865 RepID=UPI0027892587|nr:WhiB family transcriptional regulator [Streptomyces afghaniensis]MDQ1018828.1 WhiB family redox-sensing transcriptional regulator [Streptomyces afghaniensis]